MVQLYKLLGNFKKMWKNTNHTHITSCNNTSSIKVFTNQAKREYDVFFFLQWPMLIPQPYQRTQRMMIMMRIHPTDGIKERRTHIQVQPSAPQQTCLANTSSQTTTAYAPIKILVKDDPSVNPTIETLCTLDTCSLHSTNIDN